MSAPGHWPGALGHTPTERRHVPMEHERIEAEAVEPAVYFGELEFTQAEAETLSDASIVERLVDTGVSRLTATRMVELGRGDAELGRARPHKTRR